MEGKGLEEKEFYVKGLEEKGFYVIPSFLSVDECAFFLESFEQTDEKTPRLEDPTLLEFLKSRCQEKLELKPPYGPRFWLFVFVCFCSLTFKRFGLSGYWFAIERGINHSFHRDHGTFYTNQSHANMLFVWIAVQKPIAELSNLSLLERGDWFGQFVHGGASRIEDGLIWDDQTGQTNPVPPSAKETTPHVKQGDALVFKADMFHKTQDASTVEEKRKTNN